MKLALISLVGIRSVYGCVGTTLAVVLQLNREPETLKIYERDHAIAMKEKDTEAVGYCGLNTSPCSKRNSERRKSRLEERVLK